MAATTHKTRRAFLATPQTRCDLCRVPGAFAAARPSCSAPSGDVAVQQRDLSRRIHRPDAAYHPAGDGADGSVRLALPPYQSESASTSRTGTIRRSWSWSSGARRSHHHLPRRAHLDGHASARSLSPARPHRRRARRSPASQDRSRSMSSRSIGNGCSSIPQYGVARSTNSRRRSIGRSRSTSPRRR